MMERAFKYQTGETADIVRDLRRDGFVEVDVLAEDRIKPFLSDLEGLGIFEKAGVAWDYEAISFFDDQDFLCRVYVEDRMSQGDKPDLYIDFYCDYEEDSYDPVFLG
jgi:hypothetical protein